MKTTNLNLLKFAFYLCLSLNIALVSCSGEDGKDGADGKSITGPAGKDGNANVIASDWMTIQWDEALPTEASMYLNIPELDLAEFVDTGGVVLVYFKVFSGGSDITFSLPFSYKNAYYSFYTLTNPDTGQIVVEAVDPDAELILDVQNDPDYTIRYVLVPANVADQNGLASNVPPTFDDLNSIIQID